MFEYVCIILPLRSSIWTSLVSFLYSWDKKNNPHPWLNVKHDEQLKVSIYSSFTVSHLDKVFLNS